MKKLLLTAAMIMSTTFANADILKQEVVSTELVFNPGKEEASLEYLLKDLHYFKANKNLIIHIEVHSDDHPVSIGTLDNTEFTKARAESLKSALLSTFQDNIKKITTSGQGEFNPVCHEYTPECRAKNRRIVIKVHREDMGRIMMNVVIPNRIIMDVAIPNRKNSKDPLPSNMQQYSLQDLYAQCAVYFYAQGNQAKFNNALAKGTTKFGSGFTDHWRDVTNKLTEEPYLSNYEFNLLMERWYAWSCYYADQS